MTKGLTVAFVLASVATGLPWVAQQTKPARAARSTNRPRRSVEVSQVRRLCTVARDAVDYMPLFDEETLETNLFFHASRRNRA